ncbi:MAG TPA: hypothetical protein VGF22_05970, partial [Acidimicrobiales bacterium]
TLGIPRVVLAVNKMDLVDWSEARFDELAEEFACFADPLGFRSATPATPATWSRRRPPPTWP